LAGRWNAMVSQVVVKRESGTHKRIWAPDAGNNIGEGGEGGEKPRISHHETLKATSER
jgi:hypothetical protein